MNYNFALRSNSQINPPNSSPLVEYCPDIPSLFPPVVGCNNTIYSKNPFKTHNCRHSPAPAANASGLVQTGIWNVMDLLRVTSHIEASWELWKIHFSDMRFMSS
jgi:hypothetical protein